MRASRSMSMSLAATVHCTVLYCTVLYELYELLVIVKQLVASVQHDVVSMILIHQILCTTTTTSSIVVHFRCCVGR